MNNPFDTLLQEIRDLKSSVQIINSKIPDEAPIKYYSPKEISDNSPLSNQTVLAAIKDGRIIAKQFGRKYLISASEFERACKDPKSIKYKRL